MEGVAWPFWPQFRSKMESSKQSLSGDKFLHTHDVGHGDVHKVSIARIPELMYQKLALARALLGGGAAGDIDAHTVVTMMGQYGEVFIDTDMCEALQAGFEADCYQMPTFKSFASFGATSMSSAAVVPATTPKMTGRLAFVAPEDALMDESAERVDQRKGKSQGGDLEDDRSSATDLPWHYFQQESEATPNARQEKISALEAAMISASSASAAAAAADVASSASSDSSQIRGARAFTSLEQVEKFLRESSAVNEGTNIARALASLPPNVLNPRTYVDGLRIISAANGWEMDEWTVSDLEKMGAGAFCAVCQGNKKAGSEEDTSDRLVRLRYSTPQDGPNPPTTTTAFPSTSLTLNKFLLPERQVIGGGGGGGGSGGGGGIGGDAAQKDLKRSVVLVGKGVTFDTGGVNLKSANSMKTMKHDMSGSSAALGVFSALTQMNFSHPLECWLAIAENNAGPGAYRPDDVVTAITGDTIEIVHTDAEGRMLLADVLAIASRKVRIPSIHGISDVLSPKCLVDFATLTGTCVTSLSNRYIGAFSNRKDMAQSLIRAGELSGERVWPFPCDDDFDEDLKSDVADVLQCRQPTEADHIYASAFLKRFVSPAVPWVHLDMASAHRPGGLGHVPTDYTGSGVRAAVEIVTSLCRTDV